MTRWARVNNSSKQVAHEGSSWKQLKRTELQLKSKTSKPIVKDKRNEHRRIKNDRRKQAQSVCFHCRMRGHGMADCPVLRNENEHKFNICMKCGSAEHKSSLCTAKLAPGQEFACAKCFVCGQPGHLSQSCPDNPRGLYPEGGSCPLCDSVEHFKKDCPERKVVDEVLVHTFSSMGRGGSIDEEITLYDGKPEKKVSKVKPKIVRF